MNKEMLRVEDLAVRLKVPVSQIYRQAELGRLPCVRIGRYLRFPWPDILVHLSGGIFGGKEDESEN